MAVPKPNVPSAPKTNTGRLRKLLEMKGSTNVVNDHKFDIPKVDLIQSMFRGSDETRAELKAMWDAMPQEQKKALYLQMVQEMPGARPKDSKPVEGDGPRPYGKLSDEGKEIVQFLSTGEIDPARAETFTKGVTPVPRSRSETKGDVPSRTDKEVDSEIDNGAEAPVEAAEELPGEDVQAGRAKRPLPKDIDLKGNNLHGSDPRRATSSMEDRQGFRVSSHPEIVDVPGEDGTSTREVAKVVDDYRLIPQDVARWKKAEQGLNPGGLDQGSKTFTDPETGATRQGMPGRSAADRGEKSMQESYDELINRVILGQQGSPIFRPKMGSNDDLNTLYEMVRANPDKPFHADPRVAFQTPDQLAEVLYNNMTQQPLLDSFNPVSPTARRRVVQGLEDENIDNRNLGIPPVSQGQAAQLASEMGMPTSRGAQRGPIEQQAIDSLKNQIIQRWGGSGWGRKYDADGNLTDFGTGTPDEPTGLPAVTQTEARVPEQSADQGLWKPDESDSDELKDMVEGYRQAQYRHGVQERVGGLPRDKPGSPERSARSASGSGEKPDNRSAEQIAHDNADKQAEWEGNRERAATRFNSYTRDSDMKGVIQTRRTVDQVQADIDALHAKYEQQAIDDAKTAEEMRARGEKPNIGPGRDREYTYAPTAEELAPLQEELRQAKMLQGLTSKLGKKASKKDKAPVVGTKEDKPAVSTNGAKGEKTGPITPRENFGRIDTGDGSDGADVSELPDVDDVHEKAPIEPLKTDEIDPLESSASEIVDPDAPKVEPPKAEPEVTKVDPEKGDVEAEAVDPKTGKPRSRLGTAARWTGGLAAAGLAGTAALNWLEQMGAIPVQGNEALGAGGEVPVAEQARPTMTMEEEFVSPYGSHVNFNPISSEERIKLLQQLNSWKPNTGTQTAQSWRQ
jgi:hypothetical protein